MWDPFRGQGLFGFFESVLKLFEFSIKCPEHIFKSLCYLSLRYSADLRRSRL